MGESEKVWVPALPLTGPETSFLVCFLIVAWGSNSAPTSQSLKRIGFVNIHEDSGQCLLHTEGCGATRHSCLGLSLKPLSWKILIS